MKIKTLLILFHFVAINGIAQQDFFKNSSVGIQGYYGPFFVAQPKAAYVRDSYSSFLELSFQKQTLGRKTWEQTHHNAKWGVGFVFGNTGSRQYVGKMYSVFGFINIPQIITKRYTSSFRVGFGPGLVQRSYDPYKNPKNTLIGTKLNAYINLMLQNEFKLSSSLFFNISLAFTHLSNGGTKLPNLGINTPCISSGIRYAFKKSETELPKEKTSFKPSTSFKLSLSTGVKQVEWVGGPYNIIIALQPEFRRHFSRSNAYGAGISLFVNPRGNENKKQIISGTLNTPILQSGVYLLYEHIYGRISIPFQLGYYTHNKQGTAPLFQQLGIRVKINSRFNSELLLKTHLGRADYIHAGLAYTFKK